MTNPPEARPIAADVKFTFVEMLFALTIAEIALQMAQLVIAHKEFGRFAAAYMHLFLILAVVATSWVGWKTSKAPGNISDVQRVFSWQFVVLLIDVLLVVCYFVIARGVDIAITNDRITEKPSAADEAFWFMIIFAGYVLWDSVTKGVIVGAPTSGIASRAREFWKRGKFSVLSLLFSVLSWIVVRDLHDQAEVIWADLALLSLVLFFRAMKEESRLAKVMTFTAYVVFLIITIKK